MAVGLVQPHSWDLSTSNSQPGEDGSKPCSISQRAATRLRHDHQARISLKNLTQTLAEDRMIIHEKNCYLLAHAFDAERGTVTVRRAPLPLADRT